MVFCNNEKKLCYLCSKKFIHNKFLKCPNCKKYYHYKCAFNISNHLNQCLFCDRVKFKYKNKKLYELE